VPERDEPSGEERVTLTVVRTRSGLALRVGSQLFNFVSEVEDPSYDAVGPHHECREKLLRWDLRFLTLAGLDYEPKHKGIRLQPL
jgi:hypothetical protein